MNDSQCPHDSHKINIVSQIKIVKFSHFKVRGLPRTLKCKNLTIEI